MSDFERLLNTFTVLARHGIEFRYTWPDGSEMSYTPTDEHPITRDQSYGERAMNGWSRMNIEAAAEALYREYDDGKTPMNFPWTAIPEVSRENFRRIARLVLAAAVGVG